MLALHQRVVDIISQAIKPRLPEVVDEHPVGCHRPRRDDRSCFEALLFRLVTVCSWDVAGRLGKGSETTLRRRRTEWWEADVFDGLVDETLAGYDRLIGFDLAGRARHFRWANRRSGSAGRCCGSRGGDGGAA